MDTYELLCQFKSKLPPNDFGNLRKQFYMNDPSTNSDQVSDILSRSIGIPDKVEMFLNLVTNPGYALEVSQIFGQFDLLQQAQQLLSPSDFAHFIDCFDFGSPDASYSTIMINLMEWKQRLTQQQGEKMATLLEDHFSRNTGMGNLQQQQQQQASSYPTAQQFAPGMEYLMQQAYTALQHDPTLCQQFTAILDSDQMNGLPFADSIMNVYQWIQKIDPTLWYPLATVLEQMQTLQESESNQYESYEDFVQKNFLDGDGQEYLDGEIEQARVQHLFSNMSM